MRLRKLPGGGFEPVLGKDAGCSASYVRWDIPSDIPAAGTVVRDANGDPLYTMTVEDEAELIATAVPTWITSFCMLEAKHEGAHKDFDGNVFEHDTEIINPAVDPPGPEDE